MAIVALVSDFGASGDSCAAESWVWLFVLLAIAIPTGLGFVMGLVKTGLNMANLKKHFGWEVPPMLLSFPGPILYVVLGILGILMWAQMTDGCASTYSSTYGLLFVIFKIQVIMFGVAAIFGAITTFSQTVVFINSLNPEDPDLTALKKKLDEAEGELKQAERDYVQGAEQIVAKLKKQVADAERERDDAKGQLKAESEAASSLSFGEISSLVVKYLVISPSICITFDVKPLISHQAAQYRDKVCDEQGPVEEISPFKLAQIQELIGQIHKETGDAIAPYFAVAIVIFLIAFCLYLALAIVALVFDFQGLSLGLLTAHELR